MMRNKGRYLMIGLLSVGLLAGACGCTSANLGVLGFFVNNQDSSAAEASSSSFAPAGSSLSSENNNPAGGSGSSAEDNTKKNQESYQELKDKWDEASRKQQSRADEIMHRNGSSAAASSASENKGNNQDSSNASLKEPVSGTWHGPKNQHTGDQSVVTLNKNGSAKVTFDLGASETVSFNGSYTSYKNGPYEYDDIVCTVTISGNYQKYNFPSNKFTFIIDPEVENGMYARFVESGFGMTPGGSTFTK